MKKLTYIIIFTFLIPVISYFFVAKEYLMYLLVMVGIIVALIYSISRIKKN
ncbi:hypothetical protein J2S25_002127 [Mesobacillus stamsii]|uniref:Uncharacterized protein n=1 Tax=Mesobacillus stamsii TaxID=225347 RepID=A0ABU0FWL2_9BACI|nr:hypothetical protein [Mesobacillus stamsii]